MPKSPPAPRGAPAAVPGAARPDWEALRLFLSVAELGSLSRAAAALGLSQPTLTRQIAALEAALGLVLFERTVRGMALTAAGQRLLPPVQAMRDQAQAVARVAQGLDTAPRGVVRLSASEMTAVYLLPAMLAELRRQAPEIDIVLLATNRVSNLVEREADIAVRHVRPGEAGLVARKVAELPVGIYATHAYLVQRGEPQTLHDLLDHDLIAFDHGDIVRDGLVRAGVDAGRLRFAMSSNSPVVAWQWLLAGLGIGFLPVRVAAADPRVRRVLPTAPTPVLPVWMTVHQEVKDNPRLRLVFDFLAARWAALQGHTKEAGDGP